MTNEAINEDCLQDLVLSQILTGAAIFVDKELFSSPRGILPKDLDIDVAESTTQTRWRCKQIEQIAVCSNEKIIFFSLFTSWKAADKMKLLRMRNG